MPTNQGYYKMNLPVSSESPVLSVRIVSADYYMCSPVPGLDIGMCHKTMKAWKTLS